MCNFGLEDCATEVANLPKEKMAPGNAPRRALNAPVKLPMGKTTSHSAPKIGNVKKSESNSTVSKSSVSVVKKPVKQSASGASVSSKSKKPVKSGSGETMSNSGIIQGAGAGSSLKAEPIKKAKSGKVRRGPVQACQGISPVCLPLMALLGLIIGLGICRFLYRKREPEIKHSVWHWAGGFVGVVMAILALASIVNGDKDESKMEVTCYTSSAPSYCCPPPPPRCPGRQPVRFGCGVDDDIFVPETSVKERPSYYDYLQRFCGIVKEEPIFGTSEAEAHTTVKTSGGTTGADATCRVAPCGFMANMDANTYSNFTPPNCDNIPTIRPSYSAACCRGPPHPDIDVNYYNTSPDGFRGGCKCCGSTQDNSSQASLDGNWVNLRPEL